MNSFSLSARCCDEIYLLSVQLVFLRVFFVVFFLLVTEQITCYIHLNVQSLGKVILSTNTFYCWTHVCPDLLTKSSKETNFYCFNTVLAIAQRKSKVSKVHELHSQWIRRDEMQFEWKIIATSTHSIDFFFFYRYLFSFSSSFFIVFSVFFSLFLFCYGCCCVRNAASITSLAYL